MSIKEKAEALARDAGMQFDSRYGHWVSARGKFEGEEWYAPYYYDAVMNGDGETIYGDTTEEDEDAPCADLFQVDAEEGETFELDIGSWILVRYDSQGFVLVTPHKDREEAEKRFADWLK